MCNGVKRVVRIILLESVPKRGLRRSGNGAEFQVHVLSALRVVALRDAVVWRSKRTYFKSVFLETPMVVSKPLLQGAIGIAGLNADEII